MLQFTQYNLNRAAMHPESIKARVIRMSMIRLDPQFNYPELPPNILVLHTKQLIAARFVRVRVLVVAEFDRFLIILVIQALQI